MNTAGNTRTLTNERLKQPQPQETAAVFHIESNCFEFRGQLTVQGNIILCFVILKLKLQLPHERWRIRERVRERARRRREENDERNRDDV